jgi:hypothetical protein
VLGVVIVNGELAVRDLVEVEVGLLCWSARGCVGDYRFQDGAIRTPQAQQWETACHLVDIAVYRGTVRINATWMHHLIPPVPHSVSFRLPFGQPFHDLSANHGLSSV